MTRCIGVVVASVSIALAGFATIGCASQEPPSVAPARLTFAVGLTADTFGDLPACSMTTDGTVGFVTSPPSLWACTNDAWSQITCSSAQAGEVVYSSSPPMLWACISDAWLQVGLADAGPPGPQGMKSIVSVTNVDAGSPHCAAGGIRIEFGVDANGDGVLQRTELQSTSYVCNGVSASAGDAGDGGTDAAPTALQQYAAQYAQAYCAGLGRCCPSSDAGTFDVAACAAGNTTEGWRFTLPFDPRAYTADNILVDQDAGANCVAALQGFGCLSGTLDSAAFVAVTSACNGVLTGTIPTGSGGCISSFECANGYCNLPDDGGTGTCTALVAAGATCAAGNDSPDQMCSQAGGSVPALWCDLLDHPSGGATCIAPFANGTTCFNGSYWDDYGCASGICGDDSTCGTPASYPDPAFCAFWTRPASDAGH